MMHVNDLGLGSYDNEMSLAGSLETFIEYLDHIDPDTATDGRAKP
jgi:hypothetical protein